MISFTSSSYYRPGGSDPAVVDRKAKFAKLNEFVTVRAGWIVSVPGAAEITVECLPGSELPDQLRQLGYELEPDGGGERILPAGIVEKFVRDADGELVPMTPGSTMAVAEVRRHAGIARVERYTFEM